MFASKTDIQAWLRSDLISVDDANSEKPNIEAMRTIKGQLSGLFTPLVLSSWADPDSTPDQIRSIAGRLAAAFMYRTLNQTESEAVSAYAQEIYDEAISMLADIVSGKTTVLDSSDNPIDTTGANLLGFFPDASVPPQFTMTKEFA